MATTDNTKANRRSASPIALLAQAAGGRAAMAAKMARLANVFAAYSQQEDLDKRLRSLVESGIIDQAPTRIQLVVGSIDMLRFWISPAAAEYYESIGINYAFHQVLRFLDEPASVLDPVGFFSTKDTIIGHLMQVVHANPLYDLELLGMWSDGLVDLEQQVEAMIAGTHPKRESIGAVVEEPGYHARLLDYIKAFRNDSKAPAPLRENISENPRWSELDRTFGSLKTAMRYFCRLPKDVPNAARHVFVVRTFPTELAEPL